MSTQQDIYATGSESRPLMLNKENYMPWSSRLLRYAKSRPNGKLIHNSTLNGPYVRRMIPEPGDANREVTVTETFHVQTYYELTDKELKQIEADDQAIQTILLDLPEDIYAVEVDELIAERIAKTQDPLALMENSNNPYVFPAPHQDPSSFNQNYLQQPMPNPEDITDPTTTTTIRGFHQTHITGRLLNRNAGNLIGYNDVIGNQVIQNAVQNLRVQNIRNKNGLIGVPRNGHYARNYMVRPRRRDAAYLQTQLLIAQKEEAGIQLQAEEYDLMVAAADLDKIEEVNANCILMANLQQASTSGTQTDSAPIYDSDGSAKNDNNVISEDTSVEQDFHAWTIVVNSTFLWFPCLFCDDDLLCKKTGSRRCRLLCRVGRYDILRERRVLVDVMYVERDEAAKFVGDFKSLANEADSSLAKHKALELEIERLLKAVVNQDIMNIMQKESVADTSDLQTELERTKERFKNCIIKKENKYAKLWNDWYKKCDEYKYDKISYDKAYKDMQQKIKQLQAQLGDLKGKIKDTSCVLDTRNPLSQKLENENIELEFQVLNYARENAHLKATYKNLFDSISVSRTDW
nr:hypothetical protein [Tanacetum cinerariifolium]